MRRKSIFKRLKRSRLLYLTLILITMIMGLSTRYASNLLPRVIVDYGGDLLWALMVFFMIGFLFPKVSTFKVGMLALGFSFLIELSQLYQAPWFNVIRDNRLGRLVLGLSLIHI